MSTSKHQIIGAVKVVKRYSKGRCFACAFSLDKTDEQIAKEMELGNARFFPWNETTGRHTMEMFSMRPRYFKK